MTRFHLIHRLKQGVWEERKEKLAQTIATQSELREWRWKQATRSIYKVNET